MFLLFSFRDFLQIIYDAEFHRQFLFMQKFKSIETFGVMQKEGTANL